MIGYQRKTADPLSFIEFWRHDNKVMPAIIIKVATIIGSVIFSPRKMIAIVALNSGVVARIGSVIATPRASMPLYVSRRVSPGWKKPTRTKIKIEALVREDRGTNKIDTPQRKIILIKRLLITAVAGLEYRSAFLVNMLCSANKNALPRAKISAGITRNFVRGLPGYTGFRPKEQRKRYLWSKTAPRPMIHIT